MRAIHRKLLRDLVHLKGQATAIGLVMACGVATFVMSLSMLDSLVGTLDSYYRDYRFADLFAQVERAPNRLAERLAAIPGVGSVQTRVVERVTLDMPKLAAPASGMVVSLTDEPNRGLNQVYLRAGRFPHRGSEREVLLSQRFAEAHDLQSGDRISAVLNGRLQQLHVVGIALSPEFIYLISPGNILPEHERYGVLWMLREEMDAAFDMEGAFNDLLIDLMPSANEAEIIRQVDQLTDRYGGLGAYGREDQPSHQFVANEMRELRGMTLVTPSIFLGVAVFLLNIVISRLIATQREQIAALKALGYTRYEIARHYLSFVMLIVLLAGAAGCVAGAWMGQGLTALYSEFFDFPSFQYKLPSYVIAIALLASTVAAIMAVVHALGSAMSLPPAEAMRPKAPPSFRASLLERLHIHHLLPASFRMIFREFERRPVKTLFSILGIALATAILVVGSYTEDAIDYLIDFQFNQVQRYDLSVAFTNRIDSSALSTIRHMPGVLAIEPTRSVAARIKSAHRTERIAIHGLARDDGLHNLLDMTGEPVALPEHGVVISSVLADFLNVRVGDVVIVETLEDRRSTFTTPVSQIIEDFSGLSAYMKLDQLNHRMGEPNTMTGANLIVDPALLNDLYVELHEAPRVVAVNVKSATLRSFRETIAENLLLMRTFLIGFSIVIAFGVLYNTARISLSERGRDLATLRVIGFKQGEISIIQLGELTLLTAFAVPIGLVLGYGLAWLTAMSADSELISIPFIIERSTFGTAGVLIIAASIVCAIIIQRRLRALDLIAVLKTRE